MEIDMKSKMRFLDLYCMVIADGIVHPKELETLFRIGTESYGLTPEEIAKNIVSAGKTKVIPETSEDKVRMLYEMALVAWADGKLEDSERQLLKRYGLLYGVEEENIDELVNYLLEKAQNNIKEDDIIKELNM